MSFAADQDRLGKLSLGELQAKRTVIESDPASKVGAHVPWIYNQKARKKMDLIDWAITYKLAELRKARGEPVRIEG